MFFEVFAKNEQKDEKHKIKLTKTNYSTDQQYKKGTGYTIQKLKKAGESSTTHQKIRF